MKTHMVHEGLLQMAGHMAGLNLEKLPSFENPYPDPPKVYAKGDLGWACQGTKIDTCQQWLASRTRTPIGEHELQVALCIPCRPSHGKD